MLESSIAATLFFLSLAYFLTKRLGLLDAVPRDPGARVASYGSAVLSLLKKQLTNAEIERCEENRVAYKRNGVTGEIWTEQANLHCQTGGADETLPLGDLGHLHFELEGRQLSMKVLTAETGGAEHLAQLSLPVTITPQSAQVV